MLLHIFEYSDLLCEMTVISLDWVCGGDIFDVLVYRQHLQVMHAKVRH